MAGVTKRSAPNQICVCFRQNILKVIIWLYVKYFTENSLISQNQSAFKPAAVKYVSNL